MTIAGRVAAKAHRVFGDRAALWAYRIVSAFEDPYWNWRYRRMQVRMSRNAAVARSWTQSVEDVD